MLAVVGVFEDDDVETFGPRAHVAARVVDGHERARVLVHAVVGLAEPAGRGIGDAIFALPLKKYWNLEKSTMNLGLTPQIRVPTGSTSDSYPVGDGSWDMGLSASFSNMSSLSTATYGSRLLISVLMGPSRSQGESLWA